MYALATKVSNIKIYIVSHLKFDSFGYNLLVRYLLTEFSRIFPDLQMLELLDKDEQKFYQISLKNPYQLDNILENNEFMLIIENNVQGRVLSERVAIAPREPYGVAVHELYNLLLGGPHYHHDFDPKNPCPIGLNTPQNEMPFIITVPEGVPQFDIDYLEKTNSLLDSIIERTHKIYETALNSPLCDDCVAKLKKKYSL